MFICLILGFRASSCEDQVIIKGLKKWCILALSNQSAYKKHASYVTLLDSIIVEDIDHSFSQFSKSKLTPRYLRKMTDQGKADCVKINPVMIKLVFVAQVNKIEFIRYKDANPSSAMDYFSWSYHHAHRVNDFITHIDYVWHPLSHKYLLMDKRSRVPASDALNSYLAMTSGYVPPTPIYSEKTTPCGRYFHTSRPIIRYHSQVPALEERLSASNRAYEERKRLQSNADSIDNISFSSFVIMRERSRSMDEDVMRERKVQCRKDISDPNSSRDEKMIHTGFCCDEYQNEDINRSSERLWFINKMDGMEEEHSWLDAKVRREMSDIYHFDSCCWCGEGYEVMNYMKLRSARSKVRIEDTIPSRVLDWMRHYCSYTCFDKMVVDFMKYEQQKSLIETEFNKVICTGCSNVTYDFTNLDNTWRYADFGSMDRLPICGDDCFIYLKSRIEEKRNLKMSATNLAIFSFHTCFSCSKLLLPSSKICKYRSFPRMPTAFSCYSSDCIAGVLHASMPSDPLLDRHFLAPSLEPPFDVLMSVEGSSILHRLNAKRVSSGSGGRFTLSILE